MRAAGLSYPETSRSGATLTKWKLGKLPATQFLSESRLDEHRVLATRPEARPLLSKHYRLRPPIKARRILHRYSKRKDQLVFRSFAMEFAGADDMDGKPEG